MSGKKGGGSLGRGWLGGGAMDPACTQAGSTPVL